MVILKKTAMVGDGYQPVITAGMIAAGISPRPPSLRTRGLCNCVVASLDAIAEGDFGLWSLPYCTTAIRGH